MKHDKNTTNGDSFLYFFAEEGYDKEANPYFKIGIVTHATTDDTVRGWKKYLADPAPPSIVRRISKLNNGNPRQIIPIAYFRFHTDGAVAGIKKSRSVETKWKRKLREQAERTSSPEWFRCSLESLNAFIHEVIDSEHGFYNTYWLPERKEDC